MVQESLRALRKSHNPNNVKNIVQPSLDLTFFLAFIIASLRFSAHTEHMGMRCLPAMRYVVAGTFRQ